MLGCEGLLDEIEAGGFAGGAGEAGHEEDFQVWAEAGEAGVKFAAGHFGHGQIGKDEVGVRTLADGEGFDGGRGEEDAVAVGAEGFGGEGADAGLVLDDEDGFGATFGGGGIGLKRFRGWGFDGGKGDGEGGPAAGLAVDVDFAAALHDDAFDHGEAEAGAFAGGLGGEEGFEDALPDVFGHADAGIGYGQGDAGGFEAGFAGRRGDGEEAAVGHGVLGVDGEVEDDLFELVQVRADVAGIGAEVELEFDLVAEHAGDHGLHAGEDGVEVDVGRLKQLRAAEGEELAREAGGAFAGFVDLFEGGTGGRLGVELTEE